MSKTECLRVGSMDSRPIMIGPKLHLLGSLQVCPYLLQTVCCLQNFVREVVRKRVGKYMEGSGADHPLRLTVADAQHVFDKAVREVIGKEQQVRRHTATTCSCCRPRLEVFAGCAGHAGIMLYVHRVHLSL